MPEAFFTVDGDSYLPGVMTRGPWGAAMGGQIVGGLLGWGIERSGIDPEFQPARFTVDLLRPVLLEPVQIQTSVQREGRRIKLVDGALVQNGTTVARASALFLRRGEHPDGQVWSSSVEMPPLPTDSDGFPADMPFLIWGYGTTLGRQSRYRRGRVGAVPLPEVRLDAAVPPDGAWPPAHTVHSPGIRR